jgi:hypothetical protein
VTPSDVIVEARKLLQDTQAPYRYSDTDLVGYVNQTLKRMAVFRPTLFTNITSVPLTANTVIQDLPSDAHRLVQVFFIDNYNSVNEVEREVLERAYPQWVSDASGIPFNFIRHPRNATKFFLYPRPIANLTATVEYVVEPIAYTINQTILYLKDTYLGVVVDGVVFLASSIDDEHVNSNRAKLFLESFTSALGVDLQQQAILDNERMPSRGR